MKKILFYMFFLLPFTLYSQDYIDYQKSITKAERLILDSNYQAAADIYYPLFHQYDFVFAKHCYTALQVSIICNDWNKVLFFLQKGVKQGLTTNIINNSPIVNKVIKNPLWVNFQKTKYDSLRQEYLLNINLGLRDKIQKLFSLDQYYTSKVNEYRFLNYFFANRIWKREIKLIVENELIPLIKKYGFPSEKLIGIESYEIEFNYQNKLSVKNYLNEGRATLSSIQAMYILIHYFSNPNTSFNELLFNELKKGNIQPSQYAILIDFQSKYGKEEPSYYNQWHRNIENLGKINERRKNIGLDSFSLLRKKEKRNWVILQKIKSENYNHIKLWTIWGGY